LSVCLSIVVVAVLDVRALNNTLALPARPPGLRVVACDRIGYGAIDMRGLLTSIVVVVVVVVVAIVALVLCGRGCSLTLALPFGWGGSDGERQTASR
jgi:hypothetical protein